MRSQIGCALVLRTTVVAGCSAGDDGAEEAAKALATALESGSLEGVALVADSDRDRYDRALEHLTELSVAASVDEVSSGEDAATVTRGWSWDLGDAYWSYTTRPTLIEAAGTWEVAWTPGTVAPGLRSGELLDVDHIEGERGEILGQEGIALVTDRCVVRYGLDESQVPRSRWASSADRVARSLGVDPGAYRKAVAAFGPEAFVLRADQALTTLDEAYEDIPGARAVEDGESPRPDQGVRGTYPRISRASNRGDHRSIRRDPRGGRRRRVVRPAAAL